MMSEFNKHHPEKQENEVFLTNISLEIPRRNSDLESNERNNFERLTWKTKRMGLTAYNNSGQPIQGRFPVFVERSELEEWGINPENTGI